LPRQASWVALVVAACTMASDDEPGWAFTPYEKMGERPERWGIDEAGHRALARTPWVVTEKIHGANFCLLTDGVVVRAAKRRELLPDGYDFFGHLSLMPALAHAARLAFVLAAEAVPGARRLAVHGELFGGCYPHPEVAPVAGVQAVQTGVYYSPRIELCVFDLAIELAPEAGPAQAGRGRPDAGGRRYLDFELARAIAEEAGFSFACPLFVGRYEEALQHPLGFESLVPARLGLPLLPAGNIAEGVVVKPSRSVYVETAKGPVRPVLKRKIAAFSEDARYPGATAWEAGRASPAPPDPGSPALASLAAHARALAVEARLHAAVSKVGRVDARGAAPGAVGELVDELSRDILAQIDDDAPGLALALGGEDRAALARLVQRESAELVAIYLSLGAGG
jgi:Rnl2 family RNA ligase